MSKKFIWNTTPLKHFTDRAFHEIHTIKCPRLPAVENQKEIGYHECCSAAISAIIATEPDKRFVGCYDCCWPAHFSHKSKEKIK